MIVYPFTCGAAHSFEGWYASAEAYASQRDAGHVECPVCGTHEVRKLPSAPYVHTQAPARPAATVDPGAREKAIGAMRAFILANTEDVGRKFAEIARRVHYGEEAWRGLRGHATPAEAAELQEEGVEAFTVSAELGLDEVPH